MEEEGERYLTPCYVGGLHAYDGEINLKYEKNLISNKFVVKLYLEYEEKNREKLVKRELLVSLKGEFYFVKFIINSDEDDVEPSVIFGRSFMRLTKGIADFRNGIITIHPELDPFLDNSKETKKFEDDWDHLLDIDFGDIPEIDEAGLPPFVSKMGKSERNKVAFRIVCDDYFVDFAIITTFTRGTHEVTLPNIIPLRPNLGVLQYSDKYKKILDGIVMDKIKLDGEIKKQEEAIKQVKGEALKEKRGSWGVCYPDPTGS
ncbi:hypothetical protein Tco_0216271 [Tanacetum coccineum]